MTLFGSKNNKNSRPLVSIVFMIKYWGPTLDEFYKRISSQKTNFSYEIVVAYYGLDNELYKKLKSLSTKVVRIKPEEFNYGSTRDLACKNSVGKYIVTLSVDSVPVNNKWLQNMVDPMIENKADVIQGKVACPKRGYKKYPEFFYWEKDYGFYFTSEGKDFYKRYGNVSDYGDFGLAAPNLAFTRKVWENTGFGGVRYNGDVIFQKRIWEKKYRAIYKDNAAVYHAHAYRTIKSLFNRCSNEGLAWGDLGEPYKLRTMLKDMCRFDLHIQMIKALFVGELKYPAEVFFLFIRPFALYWGSKHTNTLYNDSREIKSFG